MNKFQVTAAFGNIFEVVGADEVNQAEAYRLFDRMRNSGRAVRLYALTATGSRLVREAN
jgi:hypothetical protein